MASTPLAFSSAATASAYSRADVHHGDRRAGFAQRVGEGPTDALAAARHQRYPAIEAESFEDRFGFAALCQP